MQKKDRVERSSNLKSGPRPPKNERKCEGSIFSNFILSRFICYHSRSVSRSDHETIHRDRRDRPCESDHLCPCIYRPRLLLWIICCLSVCIYICVGNCVTVRGR